MKTIDTSRLSGALISYDQSIRAKKPSLTRGSELRLNCTTIPTRRRLLFHLNLRYRVESILTIFKAFFYTFHHHDCLSIFSLGFFKHLTGTQPKALKAIESALPHGALPDVPRQRCRLFRHSACLLRHRVNLNSWLCYNATIESSNHNKRWNLIPRLELTNIMKTATSVTNLYTF